MILPLRTIDKYTVKAGATPVADTKSRSGEEVTRQAHNLKIAGSIPASATHHDNINL